MGEEGSVSSIFFLSQISQMLTNIHGHSLQKLGDQLRSMFARGLNAAMVTVVSELVEVVLCYLTGSLRIPRRLFFFDILG